MVFGPKRAPKSYPGNRQFGYFSDPVPHVVFWEISWCIFGTLLSQFRSFLRCRWARIHGFLCMMGAPQERVNHSQGHCTSGGGKPQPDHSQGPTAPRGGRPEPLPERPAASFFMILILRLSNLSSFKTKIRRAGGRRPPLPEQSASFFVWWAAEVRTLCFPTGSCRWRAAEGCPCFIRHHGVLL